MATSTSYPLSDLLYRSSALTDDSGDIEEAYDTDAYGNTLIYDAPGADDQWFTDDDVQTDDPECRYIFTGREFDAESKIYFYRARYYHPQLGRFIGRDPFLYGDGPNLYAYVTNNAVINLDATGNYTVNNAAEGLYWYENGGGIAAGSGPGPVSFLKGTSEFQDYLFNENTFATSKALAKYKCCQGNKQFIEDDKPWVQTLTGSTTFTDPYFNLLGHSVEYSYQSTVNVIKKKDDGSCCFVDIFVTYTVTIRKWYTFKNKGPLQYQGNSYWLFGEIDDTVHKSTKVCV